MGVPVLFMMVGLCAQLFEAFVFADYEKVCHR